MVNKVIVASRRALSALIAKAKEIGGLSYNTYTYLYNTLVVPIMEYSSCIWGFEEYDDIDAVQNRAIRFFLGVGKNYPRAALQGEMGWIPASTRLNLQFISWWLKTNTLQEGRTSKSIMDWSMKLAENDNFRNWCWHVKKVLVSIHLPELYSAQLSNISVKEFIPIIRNRLSEVAYVKWLDQLHKPLVRTSESGGKLRTYKIIKLEPSPPRYVLSLLDPGPRWVMASLRAGCLPLGIETGRYRTPKVPLEQRICLVCNSGQIEDEFHFVITCCKLNEVRHKMFNDITIVDNAFMHLSLFDKFLYILSNESISQYHIAKYLYKMFKLRSSLLYI